VALLKDASLWPIHATLTRRDALLDIALLLYTRDQKEFARILLDYANRLLDASLPAREHPFLNFLVYREFFAG